MLNTGTYNVSKITIVAILCASLLLLYFFRWSNGQYHLILNGDGKDYYNYLTSVFIDKNLTHQDVTRQYVMQTPTGNIDVHTIGMPLLILPFFLIGYVLALLSDAPMDGFSLPFQIMVSLAAFSYLTAGLFYLRRLLIALNYRDIIIARTLALIYFGTNLLNYSIIEPSMSHVYSFCLITIFLFYCYKLFRQPSQKYLFVLAFISALLILVRPVNGIVIVVIPFFAGSFDKLKATAIYFFQHKKQLILPMFLCLCILSLQSVIWCIQNGKLVQWSYKNEGFYFSHPQIWFMLFGFDSGFFIYTPLCFLILLGFIPLYKNNKFQFFALFLFIVFAIYLFASYCAYTYFDGIGIRTFVDFYALFSILLASLLTYIAGKKIKYVVILLISGAVCMNIIFCYQYQAGILQAAGMTFQKFKYIFLKTDKSYAYVLGGCYDLVPYSAEPKTPAYIFNHKDTTAFHSIEKGLLDTIRLNFRTNRLFVKFHFKRKEDTPNSCFNALVVVQIVSEKGVVKREQGHRINDVPSQNCCLWEDLHSQVNILSQATLPTDKVLIYIWNRDKQKFSITDYSVEVYNYTY